LTWARVGTAGIAVACALILIAHAPAILTDPIQTAVSQVRWNAYKTEKAEAAALGSETIPEVTVTSVKKTK